VAVQQLRKPGRRLDHQLDVKVIGARGEQLDQPGRRVLREEARCRNPQHPLPRTGRPNLSAGSLLQAQQLHCTCGQSQPTGRERESLTGRLKQPIIKLFAQRSDVAGDRRLADAELSSGVTHGSVAHDGGVASQLRRCHRALPCRLLQLPERVD